MKHVVRGAVSALAISLLLSSPAWAQVEPAAVSQQAAQAATVQHPTIVTLALARLPSLVRPGSHADDVAALKAYYSANPDKPLWVEGAALSSRARAAKEEIGKADDWGLAASSFALPPTTVADGAGLAEAEAQLSLAVLGYARHARGGRMDPTQLTEAIDRTGNVLPPLLVLEQIAAASAPDAYLRGLHPQHPQFERLRQLLLAVRAGKVAAPPSPPPVTEEAQETARKGRKKRKKITAPKQPPALTPERIVFNMEQWRWMPDDLGPLHVAINIPEFQFRVVKNGQAIHSERVVVGAVDTQTPIFSKDMEMVVFQPGWGVPPSIKVKQLLPGLLAGRDPVSARGYRMSYRGREVSAGSINWRQVDIRKVSIVQPPGPSNALGQVKFLFPNKHDVYMHDTPAKALFNADVRAFSHGCVRVRNPMRFAEIIFSETAGWAPTRVASLARGRPENQVPVGGKIGVHITYFTVVVDDEGKARTFHDIYGHEARVNGGLEGRMAQVARKPQNLNAVRTSLISRAPVRRTAANLDRDGRGARRGGGRAGYQTGGGFFSWLSN